MNLAVDIGNTRIKTGLFAGDQLREIRLWQQGDWQELTSYATNHLVRKVILSSVGSVPPSEFARDQEVLVFAQHTPVPIRVEYQTPHTLGLDRIAAAVGAAVIHPGVHCLIIDAGTCITMDVLHATGVFRGGNISPGLQMRLRAMHHYTRSLPEAPFAMPSYWLGHSTETALQNGGLRGAIWEIEGMRVACRAAYPEVQTLLTGGDAAFLAEHLKKQIFVHPNLVLIGLNKILNDNG